MLKATTARWRGTHKQSISEWPQCRRLMEIRFGEEISFPNQKYTGLIDLVEHIEQYRMNWKEYPREEWVHRFIHTLEMVPIHWYTLVELRQGTVEWESLEVSFTQTFEFTSEHLTIDVALQEGKDI